MLALAERLDGYSDLLTERKAGEIRNSLVLVFAMYAAIIALCWGMLGERWLTLACVLAWGVGDAVAALVGKRFGHHTAPFQTASGRKTVEGTIGMFLASSVSVLLVLLAFAELHPLGYVLIPLAAGATAAIVELYTPNGYDTVTCPLAAAAVILPLVHAMAA